MHKNYLIKFLVFSLLLICPLFAFSKKAKSSPYQNELLVIGALKNLYTQQATFYKNWGNRNFGTLGMLHYVELIDANLAAGEKYGYYFSVRKNDRSVGIPPQFFVYARPKVYGRIGKRSFYMDNRCIIHAANKSGEDASENDPVFENCIPTIAFEEDKISEIYMRDLAAGQEIYKTTIGNGNYGNIGALFVAGLIGGHRLGLNLMLFPQTATEPAKYKAWLTPLYRENGIRSFYIDSTGVVRGADHQGHQASEDDPVILEVRTAKQKVKFKD